MKLTIITVNRNNAEGLRITMQSVMTQNFQDFEYIVIDGASTDESVEVIKSFDFGQRLFSWISESDTGIYNAMNKGIRMASGEYLLFLNSGDYLINEDVLERVFTSNSASGADILTARCNVSDNGKVVWTSPYIKNVTLKSLYTIGLPHQATFIRRSLFDIYGQYREDFRYNSDIAFWYRTIIFGNAVACGVNVVVADYNLSGISSTQSKTPQYRLEMQEILSEGFLPKVLPDYDEWKVEQRIHDKYHWIEHHRWLQRLLTLCRKVLKQFNKLAENDFYK